MFDIYFSVFWTVKNQSKHGVAIVKLQTKWKMHQHVDTIKTKCHATVNASNWLVFVLQALFHGWILIEFHKWWPIKLSVKFISKWKRINTNYPCLPLHLVFSFAFVFIRPSIRFVCISIQTVKKWWKETFHVTSVCYSCISLVPLLWRCIVILGIISNTTTNNSNRTWWQWFTDFTAIFAHQHINYTFNAVQSNSIIRIKASDKSLTVKQL